MESAEADRLQPYGLLSRRLSWSRFLRGLLLPGLNKEINHEFFFFLFAVLFLLPLNSVEMEALRNELKIALSSRIRLSFRCPGGS